MKLRKPMTETERKVFKEAVIKDYQLKEEVKEKRYFSGKFPRN